MESNSNDNYVLVLEDRTEVKNKQEAGKLSVVSSVDEKGNLKTTEAIAANQAAFLKFNNKDGLLKNFMTNFLKQFNNPTHFGLYKVLADNVEQGVDNLRAMLQSREKSESKQQLAEMGVPFGDYLPQQKNATAIDPEKVDWKMLDNLGLSRERLEQSGELEKMLNWQKSNLLTIAVPIGDTTIYTEARLAFRTDDNGNIGLAIHPLRKEPQLDFPYMGYKFSPEEKEQLLTTGNLGKTIEETVCRLRLHRPADQRNYSPACRPCEHPQGNQGCDTFRCPVQGPRGRQSREDGRHDRRERQVLRCFIASQCRKKRH